MSQNRPRTIGVLCVGGMQVCWLACALWLLDVRAGAGRLPVAGILSGLPLAFTFLRLTPALPLIPRLSAVLAGWSIWTAVLIRFSALPAEPLTGITWLTGLAGRLLQAEGGPTALQLTALAGAGAWICGCRLAVISIGFVRILSEFQLGLLILLFVFFFAALWESTPPGMIPVVFIFFTLFLLGIAVVRDGAAKSWRQANSDKYWLTVLVLNTVMVLGAGIVLTAAVTPGTLKLMLDLLQALWDRMVDGVARLMAFLAGLFPRPEVKAFPIGGVAGPAPPDASILPELLRIPDYVRRVAAFLVSAFWLVLFGVCLWRIVAQISEWLRRQMQDFEDAEMETMQGAFRQDLLRMLRRIRRRLSEWMAWLRCRLWGQALPEICSPEAAAIRRVYRALLSWSADAGCARSRSQTPHEFLERLVTWLPEARLQLAEITEHYVAVRYGGRKLDADAVKRVELIWLDVRHLRKRRRKGA